MKSSITGYPMLIIGVFVCSLIVTVVIYLLTIEHALSHSNDKSTDVVRFQIRYALKLLLITSIILSITYLGFQKLRPKQLSMDFKELGEGINTQEPTPTRTSLVDPASIAVDNTTAQAIKTQVASIQATGTALALEDNVAKATVAVRMTEAAHTKATSDALVIQEAVAKAAAAAQATTEAEIKATQLALVVAAAQNTVVAAATQTARAVPTATPTPTHPPERSAPLRLVYVHGEVGNTDIYVTNVESGQKTIVADANCDEAEPAWSPDGFSIVYQANCIDSYDLYHVNSSGGRAERLTSSADLDEREPDYSPNGSQIVYRANSRDVERNNDGELWVMNANGSNAYGLGIRGRSPDWSPDGRQLALMSESNGSWEIYVYDFASRQTLQLTNCSANCRWPTWSPDGLYVIYHSTTALGNATPDTIWYVSATGGTPIRVVTDENPGRPTWFRQGWIAFNSNLGIEYISVSGGARHTIVSGSQNWAPIWSE